MIKEQQKFDRFMSWTRRFRNKTGSNPSPYQLYAAGWKAAMHEHREHSQGKTEVQK